MSIHRKKLLLLIALAGLAVKSAEFLLWYHSVLRYYNQVPGLDMATLLRFGEWGSPGNGIFFTPHRAIIALFWKLNGNNHFIPGIVAVQALFSVLGAVLSADLALRFFGRRPIAALAVGAVFLLYGPFFIYEFSVLQEVVALNLILLAFFSAVSARSRAGFAAAGAALGLCVTGRPTALFFVPAMLFWCARRQYLREGVAQMRKLLWMSGGIAAALAAASLFNRLTGGNWRCFFDVLPYSLAFNTSSVSAAGAPAGHPFWLMLGNAVSRLPQLFLPLEIPENLNYYFLCDAMPVLRFLPGPGLLLPAALAGILLLLRPGELPRPAATVLIPIATLMLPLCVRDPIGRYRLTLLPYFILAAGFWIACISAPPGKRRRAAVPQALLALLAGIGIGLLAPEPYLRAADYLTHALALEAESGGNTTPESLSFLAEGWQRSGFRHNPLGINLALRFLETGNIKQAERVIRTGIANAAEADVYRYYLALIHADRGEFRIAEELLRSCRPDKLGHRSGKYHYLHGEMLRRRGAYTEALKQYDLSLRELKDDPKFALRVRQAVNAVSAAEAAGGNRGTASAPPAPPSRE